MTISLAIIEVGPWPMNSYLINCDDTGISAVIDQRGQIVKSLGLHKRGIISSDVPAMVGATPWALLGDWPWLALMLVVFVAVIMLNARRSPIELSRHSTSRS